jgi:hypothetical protein
MSQWATAAQRGERIDVARDKAVPPAVKGAAGALGGSAAIGTVYGLYNSLFKK